MARRKAEVLSALMGGLVTVESLHRKYDLTEEELLRKCIRFAVKLKPAFPPGAFFY